MVPARSDVASRLDVDLSTGDGTGTTIPLVVANMTAVAGRRMAETVARRGGHRGDPAGHPDRRGRRRRRLGQAAAPGATTPPITLGPTDTVGDALPLLPKRAHGAVIVVDDDGRPVGVVTEADYRGRGPVHPAAARDVRRAAHRAGGRVDPRAGFDRLARRPSPARPGGGRRRPAGRRADPDRARCAPPSTRRRVDDRGPAADRRGASASTATSTGKAAALLEAGVDCLVVDTAHGHQERMIEALQAVRDARPGGAGRGRQRGHRRGRTRPGRGRRGHRQGRRRAGRDVHHPDDDRRGPAAVLRGARVRGRGPRARPARLGRRRGAAPPRRRAGAGRRRVHGDDRLLVRRHLRVARRPAHRRRRPALQGELRDGLGPGGRAPDRRRQRRSTGPARRSSRRASPRRGCTSTRPGPASRT